MFEYAHAKTLILQVNDSFQRETARHYPEQETILRSFTLKLVTFS